MMTEKDDDWRMMEGAPGGLTFLLYYHVLFAIGVPRAGLHDALICWRNCVLLAFIHGKTYGEGESGSSTATWLHRVTGRNPRCVS